jgi:hypothetical protein
MISPTEITLQPHQRSAFINITVIDNEYAEGDNPYSTISADSPFGSGTFPITIRENDREYYFGSQQKIATIVIAKYGSRVEQWKVTLLGIHTKLRTFAMAIALASS